jgi:hypothetical protein
VQASAGQSAGQILSKFCPENFPSVGFPATTPAMKIVSHPSIWTYASIKTADLILDEQNPRIAVRPNASQDEIRAALVETEEVDDLAKKIVKIDGNMAGERIIVMADKNGRYRVLEGNRRACACQMLLNPSLIPQKANTRFPAITPATRTAITELAADIAPNREAAEPIITRRHIEAGIKQWNTVAKHRRIRRLLAAGRTLQAISEEFDQSPQGLKKLMREMALLDRVQSLTGWTPEEKAVLADPQLKTNPFTRFFSLEGVRPALTLKFDEDGNFKSDLQEKDLNSALQFIARKFLIPSGPNGEPEANTRTTPSEIWKQFAAVDKRTAKKLKVSAAILSGKAKKKLRGRSASFFQSLECPIKHDQLRQLTKEISTIDYPEFPAAATYLVRAIIEQSLDYAIGKAQLDKLLHSDWNTKRKQQTPSDPGLDFTLRFAIKHADKIFRGGVPRILSHWQNTKKFSDIIIHGKWAAAHAATLEQFASFVRPLIQKILDGSALK